jgi:hypothetical protein
MLKKMCYIILPLLIFASCDEDNPTESSTDSLVGTWSLTSLRADGMALNPDEEDEIPARIRFHSDKSTGVVWIENYGVPDDDNPISFSWSVNRSTVTIMVEGEFVSSMSYSVSDNGLTLTEQDGSETIEFIFTRE